MLQQNFLFYRQIVSYRSIEAGLSSRRPGIGRQAGKQAARVRNDVPAAGESSQVPQQMGAFTQGSVIKAVYIINVDEKISFVFELALESEIESLCVIVENLAVGGVEWSGVEWSGVEGRQGAFLKRPIDGDARHVSPVVPRAPEHAVEYWNTSGERMCSECFDVNENDDILRKQNCSSPPPPPPPPPPPSVTLEYRERTGSRYVARICRLQCADRIPDCHVSKKHLLIIPIFLSILFPPVDLILPEMVFIYLFIY
ncbi:hypothetical protein V1478_008000, partial [Vespula squamosa]